MVSGGSREVPDVRQNWRQKTTFPEFPGKTPTPSYGVLEAQRRAFFLRSLPFFLSQRR